MSIAVRKLKGVSRVRIEDELTIYSAAVMKDALLEALAKGDEFEVNLEKVTEMDTAGAQLLVAFKRACDREDKPLHFIKHSPPVVEVLETLGLTSYFGDPVVMPAEGA
jgi:anti-anti-sigma factor